MPRPKAKKPIEKDPIPRSKYGADPSEEPDWGGYINIKIDAETKAKYAAWVEGDGSAFWSLLEDTLSEGMKYGLSYDHENDCYIATFTGCGVVGFNSRYCLSARSDRFEDATALLVFKHAIICEGNWGNFRPSRGTVDNWG